MNPKAVPATMRITAANLTISLMRARVLSPAGRSGRELLLEPLAELPRAPVDALGENGQHAALGIEEISLRVAGGAVALVERVRERVGEHGEGQLVAGDEPADGGDVGVEGHPRRAQPSPEVPPVHAFEVLQVGVAARPPRVEEEEEVGTAADLGQANGGTAGHDGKREVGGDLADVH